ncbi:HAD family hydrolase [Lachnospiraceae bacterium LCP25S3_G4]
MIKGIVFDMDGLIFDSERIVKRAWNIVGESLGYSEFGEHIFNTVGLNMKSRNVYFRNALGEDFPMTEFNEKTRAVFCEIVKQEGMSMKPGLQELLKYTKEKGLRTAVATSSREEHATQMLKEAGIYENFNAMVFGDIVKNAKPDPEIYLTACELIALDPSECLALEDAPAGVRSAISAGMKVVLIPDLVQPDREIQALATYQRRRLDEVITILEEIALTSN